MAEALHDPMVLALAAFGFFAVGITMLWVVFWLGVVLLVAGVGCLFVRELVK